MMNDILVIGDGRFSNFEIQNVELASGAKHGWERYIWELPMVDDFTLTANVPEEFMEWIKRTRKELGFDQ